MEATIITIKFQKIWANSLQSRWQQHQIKMKVKKTLWSQQSQFKLVELRHFQTGKMNLAYLTFRGIMSWEKLHHRTSSTARVLNYRVPPGLLQYILMWYFILKNALKGQILMTWSVRLKRNSIYGWDIAYHNSLCLRAQTILICKIFKNHSRRPS